MSRIIYGNLAVKPVLRQMQPVQKKGKKKKIVVKHGLPLKEKLTYLFLVVVFVAVSGILLSRYSYIAEVNYNIQEVKNRMIEVQKEIDLLQIQHAELSSPERILKKAEELGLTQHAGSVKTVRAVSLSNQADN
jgi:cell division protein FtsL